MGFIHSQEPRVLIVVFAVLFFGEYKVGSVSFFKLHTIGDTITLPCRIPFPHTVNYNSWKRNGILLADENGVSRDYPRITHTYTNYPDDGFAYYDLTIDDARIIDSAIYSCFDYKYDLVYSYDLHIIGCSSCVLAHHNDPDKRKVVCNLDNYRASERTQISINTGRVGSVASIKTAVIEGNTFSFPIFEYELNNEEFRFNPYTNTQGEIKCQLPTEIPSTQPSTHYPTTSSISTPHHQKSISSYRPALQDATSGAAISTTEHHTLQNNDSNQSNNSNQGKNLSDSDITMIIVISGSIFILILIVLIVILRCKQKKNHQENKHNGILSVDGKDTNEHPEACYESVDDASQKVLRKSTSNEKMKDKSETQLSADAHGGMVDNILYDSSDKIADCSISRREGPLDNALYAMPDKRKTLDRESKSGTIADSFAADILYGNSSIISQQGQKDNQGGDQYENVEMPRSGGGGNAEEIPLYEMPDKAPQRNTLKATPKAEQTSTVPKEEVVNVNALYAEVDKTKKK